MENKKISTTLLGHEIVLQDAVAKVAGAVEWVEAQVKDAIKDLPYASIVMAGVSLVLPLLKNPAAAEEANRDGFTYVTSQMRYFAAMESLLLPQETNPDLKDDLAKRLVNFYKLIIDFQVQSIIRFYRTRTKNFFRGTVNYDGWDQKLQDIKDTDAALVARFETAMSASSLQELRVPNDLVAISRDHLDFARKLDRHMSDADNRACLRDLHTTNPYHDKERIELDKGGLLKYSYRWVLGNPGFQRLRSTGESRLLWIKGDPGKGKTMLLCVIINELVKSTPPTTNVSFFCQATDTRINNATAVENPGAHARRTTSSS